MTSDQIDYTIATVKVFPPVVTLGSIVAGITLQDWVLVATLVYTVLQCATLLKKLFRKDPKLTKDDED